MVRGRSNGNQEQMCSVISLIPIVMGIARAGSKSPYAPKKTLKRVDALSELIDTIPSTVCT
jgi:hypothetical protein